MFHSILKYFSSGEYSIIQDSMGLTVPYEIFKGALTFDDESIDDTFRTSSNQNLKGFADYIQEANSIWNSSN